MKLTVLTENMAGAGYIAEHGLSYLVESENQKILFDTGASDVFIKNATHLGINLDKEIHTIVLSHGHWDHGNGLSWLNNKTLITHPASFTKRYRKTDRSYIGLSLTKEEAQQRFDLQFSESPLWLSNNMVYLGVVPRLNKFESKSTSFIDEGNNPDFVPDDSALAIIENGRLYIITGCSHAGICNILNYAMRVTGIKKVETVIGGFHLKHNNLQTAYTINYFKELGLSNIYPSHCTELEAMAAFLNAFAFKTVKTGNQYNFTNEKLRSNG